MPHIVALAALVLLATACAPVHSQAQWPNGTVRKSGELVGGRQEGEWTYRYESGKCEALGAWKNDHQQGHWAWWYENGSPKQEGDYDQGLRTGAWRFWHGSGALASEGAYEQDRQQGPWRYLREDGTLAAEVRFEHGVQTASAAKPAASVGVLSPQPQLPGFWTAHEEANAAALIQNYTSGTPVDGYFTAPNAWNARQRRELIGKPLAQTRLLACDGSVIDLADQIGKRDVVLVIMRGFSGQVCLYCSTQTAAICKSLERFTAAGAQVVIVYPGPAEAVPAFMSAVASLGSGPPTAPVCLDVDLALVRALGVEGKLSKPTSIILDRRGIVRSAYVGIDLSDRPNVDELIAHVKALGE